MEAFKALLREGVAAFRRLFKGPATLERTLALTLGGLVLASILVLAVNAVGLLRKQAEQHALARIELAGAAAREEIRRLSEDTLTAARVVAARPTLHRLIRAGNREQVELFLRRTCTALNLQACAVMVGDTVLASTRPVGWLDAHEAAGDQGERFMLAPIWQPDGLLGATAGVPNFVDTRVIALRYFDAALAKSLTEETGVQVRLVRLSNWLDNVEPDFKELHSTALSRGARYARRIDGARPVRLQHPDLRRRPAKASRCSRHGCRPRRVMPRSARFVRRFGWTAFLLGVVAVGAALVLARRIVRPLQAVAESATRLGRGDFSTSIPMAGGGPEIDALARTLEDMRQHLVDASTTLRRREADAEALLRGVVEGVFAVDGERNLRYLNPQAERMLGIDAQAATRAILRRRAASLRRRGRRASLRDGVPHRRRARPGPGAGHGVPAA